MNKLIIMGSGAAPGVPSLTCGWGDCDSAEPRNCRTRTGTYLEMNGVKLLIDTSPDLRTQLICNDIREIDGVLYTHTHADHLHGIDDLREITRIRLDKILLENGYTAHLHGVYDWKELKDISEISIDIFASPETTKIIKSRFSYLIASHVKNKNIFFVPSLRCNVIRPNHPFYIKGLKITPLKLLGHSISSIGYAFNDGEVVYIADFKSLASSVFEQIKVRPKLMIVPLTTPFGQPAHAGLNEVLEYIEKINPERAIINHMASECDYQTIDAVTPENVSPAYDNMIIEF